MITPLMLDSTIKVLIDLILATAAIIIVKRDMLSLISTYSVQSFLLFVMALALYAENGSVMLLYLAALTLISKVIIIPKVMKKVQKKLNIKRDIEFHYLTPTGALFASMFIILVVYLSLSRILAELPLSNVFFLGATVGISLMFMGMIIIFSRKQTITNIVGYLTMENGVLLFSLFLAELPMIIEVLIIVDLVMLTLMATILAFGIDATIDEFHARLNPFRKIALKSKLFGINQSFGGNNSGDSEAGSSPDGNGNVSKTLQAAKIQSAMKNGGNLK